MITEKPTEWWEVLLDNQAETSIVHPKMLRNIRRMENPATIGGVTGHSTTVNMIGELTGFGDVLCDHTTGANILCMADVEDMYPVIYKQGVSYTVKLDDGDLVFHRRGKLYVADMSAWETHRKKPPSEASVMVTTTAQRESNLTAKELKRVNAARDFIRGAGYPSLKEAVHLVEDGNLINNGVTARDIRVAFDIDTIDGVYPAMAKGKATKVKSSSRLPSDDNIKSKTVQQQLHSDVMHVDEQKFLVSVVEPLHLTLSTHVERETATCLGTALEHHLQAVREKGFNPVRVFVDPQRSLHALTGKFPGVEIDVQGAGDHLATNC